MGSEYMCGSIRDIFDIDKFESVGVCVGTW